MKSNMISLLGKMVTVIISPKLHNHEENEADQAALPENRSSSSVSLSQEGDGAKTGTRVCVCALLSLLRIYICISLNYHTEKQGRGWGVTLLLYWLRLKTCVNIKENVC